MKQPAIIIPVYQKTGSLKRLLKSLLQADYTGFEPGLIFSIDGNASKEVIQIAESFEWLPGDKKIIRRDRQLGVDKHILECAALSLEYEAVILLEDDAFVSPQYYQYAAQTIEYYETESALGQISLYSYPFNEITAKPFTPLASDSDVYLLKKACSRGQVWTKLQWQEFSAYFEKHRSDYEQYRHLPKRILNWDPENWERIYTWYLKATGRYVLYPYQSYSTMFGDLGAHVKEESARFAFQSGLNLSKAKNSFKDVKDLELRYDEYFELDEEYFRKHCPALRDYSFDVDLNASKETAALSKDYVLSSRPVKNSLLSFGRELKPAEANVLLQVEGNDIQLARREDLVLKPGLIERRKQQKRDWLYYYPNA